MTSAVSKIPEFEDDKAYAVVSRLFCVFDHTSKSYDAPRAFPSRGVAMRAVMDAVKEPGTVFNKHPEQFSLFYIGDFNNANARISLTETPELVFNFWEL